MKISYLIVLVSIITASTSYGLLASQPKSAGLVSGYAAQPANTNISGYRAQPQPQPSGAGIINTRVSH